MPSDTHVFDELKLPFIFVPHGAPEPIEWLSRHPDYIKLPATFVPRGRGGDQANRSADGPPPIQHRTVDGLAAASGPTAPRPSSGSAMSGAMSAATNQTPGPGPSPDDPIAAFCRANEALATAASAHALEHGLRQAGFATADMRPVDDPSQQEPLARPPIRQTPLARPPIRQTPLAPPPGRAFPSPAISDSHSSPGALLPFLRPGFVPGTKDVIEFGTDGLIHDPTMEKLPPEIGLPRRTDIDT